MRTHGQCTDAFLETHSTADVFSPSPASPLEAIHQLGMSCDSPLNSWSAAKNIPQHIKAQGGKRLDYIFYRQPAPPLRRPVSIRQGDGTDDKVQIGNMEEHVPVLKCTKTEVVLTEHVPGQAYSYSDHFGLVATFTIDAPTNDLLGSGNPFETPNRLSRASEHSQPSYAPPTTRQSGNANNISSASATAIIKQAQKVLASYKPISARTKRLHLRVSSASALFLLALAIGSAWQPKSYLQPIFTLLGALAGASAATFFYLGFVWGRWEEGLLTEVIDEMEIEVR
jgi:sphingomyelin phosphodiesterase 2